MAAASTSLPPELESALQRAEKALASALARMRSSEPERLAADCKALQTALGECALKHAAIGRNDRETELRLRRMGAGMEQLREAMARSNALVQRQLQTLLPGQGHATYGRQAPSYGRGRTGAAATSLSA